MELGPGLVIDNKVRLQRLLGQGGMGSVWLADHMTLDTEVAVKFISGELASNTAALRRFTTEATSAAKIKSPHVVQVFDHGIYGARPYIVMELLQGEDLAQRLARLGPVRFAEMAVILQQAAKALTQAHALGIVHRDIKPANVFLMESGGDIFVKLLDFGIAKQTAGAEDYSNTATGTMVGTPYYMSPEQIFGPGEVDFRADQWALSVLAYECLTGVMPFDGPSLGAIHVAIHSVSYVRPSERNPRLPAEVDRWFAKTFAKEPSARFNSVKDLADTFAALIPLVHDGSSLLPMQGHATPSPMVATPGAPHQLTLGGTTVGAPDARRRGRVVAIAGALVALVAGAGVAVFIASRGPGPSDGSSGAPAPPVISEPPAAAAAQAPSRPAVTPSGDALEEPVKTAGASATAAPQSPSSLAGAKSTAVSGTPPLKATSPTPGTGSKRRDHGF